MPWTLDYYRRLRDRLKAMPGIEGETLAMIPVLQNNEWDNWVTIEGYTPKQGETPDPHMQYCSTDYFAALKIPIMLGRDFTIKDVAGAPKVGIVNQRFANRYFGGETRWAATLAWASIPERRWISKSWASPATPSTRT